MLGVEHRDVGRCAGPERQLHASLDVRDVLGLDLRRRENRVAGRIRRQAAAVDADGLVVRRIRHVRIDLPVGPIRERELPGRVVVGHVGFERLRA